MESRPREIVTAVDLPTAPATRSDGEREKLFGVCIDPKGITFRNARERTMWLARRYSELEAQALRNRGQLGGVVCASTGGQWSGVSCYTPAGRPYVPNNGPPAR